eukprot:5424363-Amphidinium_carterae.1
MQAETSRCLPPTLDEGEPAHAAHPWGVYKCGGVDNEGLVGTCSHVQAQGTSVVNECGMALATRLSHP